MLLTDGAGVLTYDGKSVQLDCGMYAATSGGIEKMFATGTNNVYGVGYKGTIVHFDGTSWQKVESGTTVDLQDVSGSPDGTSVAASGYTVGYLQSTVIASCGSSPWKVLWQHTAGGPVSPYASLVMSVYCPGADSVVVAASFGTFIQAMQGDASSARQLFPTEMAPYRVRGNGRNDIIAAGSGARIYHYNGASWQKVYSGDTFQPLYSVAVSPHLIVAVGEDATVFPYRAMIVVGRRI